MFVTEVCRREVDESIGERCCIRPALDSAQSTLAQLAQLRSALRAASLAFLIAPTCATNAFYTPRYLS